ncbi:MAG: arylsulfatase [Saprospiraceae bacterium]|nr:arylsulfatase [Saprospiraceae bacterium]
MKQYIWLACLPLLLAARCTPSIQSNTTAQKPNIIFIMSDDQGYADLGCYDSEFIKTPVLDKMAAEGMRFTQAYAGSPVCAPTRCVLMTGKHSGHITRRDNRAAHEDLPFNQRRLIPLNDADFTLAEMLKEVGYVTAGMGKWGLGNPGTTGTPYKQGFDYFMGYLDQMHAHNYYTPYLMQNADTLHIPQNENGQQEIYSHDLIMEEALEFVNQQQDTSFFLYLPLCLPHGKYEIPDNSAYADRDWPERVKNYAAMLDLMDKDIGRLFALLKQLKIDENTIVFFTSDNGPNPPFIRRLQSNKPFRGSKRQLLEGGIRTPLIARWPGHIEAGTTSDQLVTFWDVMPTLAELSGATKPQDIDGLSFLPTLSGEPEQQSQHDYLYWEFYNPFQQAVRVGKWKGIRVGTAEPIHLYDLENDLLEQNDLAEAQSEIVAKMKAIMEEAHSPNPYWPTVAKAGKAAKEILR